ncbi:MAG: hypothetical protein C0506_10480 [Anaerolinea sp.]|nr:hypothetical protein [Anaerolinea sp.]
MNDAIALLAISQLVCLGAIFYLYTQVQALRRLAPVRRAQSTRVHPLPEPTHLAAREAASLAARHAYAASPVARRSPRPAAAAHQSAAPSTLADRVNELGLDVPALARRMHKSEEEVRLLLRRQGIAG